MGSYLSTSNSFVFTAEAVNELTLASIQGLPLTTLRTLNSVNDGGDPALFSTKKRILLTASQGLDHYVFKPEKESLSPPLVEDLVMYLRERGFTVVKQDPQSDFGTSEYNILWQARVK